MSVSNSARIFRLFVSSTFSDFIAEREALQKKVFPKLEEYCTERSAPLAGNSIHQDRRFIVKYMPRLDHFLHYRMIDVSTVKELAKRWYPDAVDRGLKKRNTHRAMDDIRESIEELKYFRRHVFR